MNPSKTTKPILALREFFKQQFERALNKRLRPNTLQKLNNKGLFIIPSRGGGGFLALICLLWLLGTNYENNLVLALAYCLIALFIVTIHHTFFNLSGLEVQYLDASSTFFGEQGEIRLQVSCGNAQSKENIALSFPKGSRRVVDLIDDHSQIQKLFVPCTKRGWFRPGRLLVESFYPLGLIRCWSLLDMDAKILVYPQPIRCDRLPISGQNEDGGDQLDTTGAEDFYGFRLYQAGMSTKHIAWKHYAQGRGLYAKEFVSYQQQRVQLDWAALDGLGREARLSRLCYWVLKLSAQEQDYGLTLPGMTYPPSRGLAHKQTLLKALALFESESVYD